MASGRRKFPIILLLILVLLAAGGVFIWPHLEGQAPVITLDQPPTHLGRKSTIGFTVQDQGRGLDLVMVHLVQKGKNYTVFNQNYGPSGRMAPGELGLVKLVLSLEPLKLGLAQGPATLTIEARDRSLAGFGQGNTSHKSFELTVDTTPPQAEPAKPEHLPESGRRRPGGVQHQ